MPETSNCGLIKTVNRQVYTNLFVQSSRNFVVTDGDVFTQWRKMWHCHHSLKNCVFIKKSIWSF